MRLKFASAMRCAMTAILAACLGGGGAMADANDNGKELVVRTYNVAELIQPIPNYYLPPTPVPSGGGGLSGGGGGVLFSNGGGGGGGVRQDGTPAVDPAENLLKLIQDVVDPAGWRDRGGSVGSARIHGNALVVSQTEASHRAIQSLLDGLQRESARNVMIQVDAHWLMLTPQQVAAMEVPRRDDAKNGARIVTLDALKDEAAIYCRARTLGFNGQTLSLVSGKTTSVVKDATPVVGTGVALYYVQTEREQSGVSLQVTPRIGMDRQSIIVDIHSLVSEGLPGNTAAMARDAANAVAASATQPVGTTVADATREATKAIDRPDRIEQNFQTTVRLAPGVPVIVGGMTMEPSKHGSRQLYLVVSASQIVTPLNETPGKQ